MFQAISECFNKQGVFNILQLLIDKVLVACLIYTLPLHNQPIFSLPFLPHLTPIYIQYSMYQVKGSTFDKKYAF